MKAASRESEWRWFSLFAIAYVALMVFIAAMWGCTPNYYNGGDTEIQPVESYIRVTIQNNRSADPIDPTFYLVGQGRHSLGVVKGLETKSVLVDTKWLPTDGCVRVVAHYVGEGDWTSEQFCWRRGEVIEVALQNIFSTSSAWSHR